MIYQFVDCEIDTQLYKLSLGGESVSVQPIVF